MSTADEGSEMGAQAKQLLKRLQDWVDGDLDPPGLSWLPDGIQPSAVADRVRLRVITADREARCFTSFIAGGGWSRKLKASTTLAQAYKLFRIEKEEPAISTDELAMAVPVLRREHMTKRRTHPGTGDGGTMPHVVPRRNAPWTYVHDTCLRALAHEFQQQHPASIDAGFSKLICRLLGRTNDAVAERMEFIYGSARNAALCAPGKRTLSPDDRAGVATPGAEPTRADAEAGAVAIDGVLAHAHVRESAPAVGDVIQGWGHTAPAGVTNAQILKQVDTDDLAKRVQEAVVKAEQERSRFDVFANSNHYPDGDRPKEVRESYIRWRESQDGPRIDQQELRVVTDTLVAEHRAKRARGPEQEHMLVCRSYQSGGAWTIVEDACLRALTAELAEKKMSTRAICMLADTLLPTRSVEQIRHRLRLVRAHLRINSGGDGQGADAPCRSACGDTDAQHGV